MGKLLILLCCAGLLTMPAFSAPEPSVEDTLDAFHAAAARADLETYLGLLTPEAVFLGTDGTERWQGDEFTSFVSGHFSKGEGWAYAPKQRQVTLSDNGKLAWFDEMLDNDQLGLCRGSGVLVLNGGQWRIAQYNLSVPIPNPVVLDFVAQIQALEATATAANGELAGEAGNPVSVNAAGEGNTGTGAATDTGEVEQPIQKRCRKRHKTNTRAGC